MHSDVDGRTDSRVCIRSYSTTVLFFSTVPACATTSHPRHLGPPPPLTAANALLAAPHPRYGQPELAAHTVAAPAQDGELLWAQRLSPRVQPAAAQRDAELRRAHPGADHAVPTAHLLPRRLRRRLARRYFHHPAQAGDFGKLVALVRRPSAQKRSMLS